MSLRLCLLAACFIVGGSGAYAVGQAPATAPTTRRSAEETDRVVEGMRGEFVGIGAQIEKGPDGVVVRKAFPGSGAEQAALKDGDIIVKVDGKPTAGMTVEEAVRLLRGPADSTVTLDVRSPGEADRTVMVTRSVVVVSGVEHRMLAGKLGLLVVSQFNGRTVEAARRALDEFSAAGAVGLVLDLCGNTGGSYDPIVRFTGLFVPAGRTLWFTRPLDGTPAPVKSKSKPVTTLPVVVLVDSKTTGGELVAAAIQSNKLGMLVGQKTSGLTAGKEMVKHPDGSSELVLKTEYLVEPQQPITGRGVEPDVPMPSDATPEQVLNEAVKILQARLSRSRADAPIRHVHDPTIATHGGEYYVFSTGKGIPMRRSKDLVHWETAGRVFDEDVPAWAKTEIPGAKDIWAPDISFYNGQYHLYYSVSTFGSQRSCIGLATNKTLDPADKEYQWVDHGKVLDSFPGKDDFNAIDPALVLDTQKQPWLAFGSFWGGIKLIRLEAQTGKPDPRDTQVHTLAARPVHHAIEAPFLVYKKGFYYLFVSFDQCCKGVNSTYKIMVGRSKDVTGPYIDWNDRPMRDEGGTLVLAGYDNWRGPGHNAVLLDKSGDWLVHHTYDADDGGAPKLQIRPLLWDRNGWPLAGEPIAESPPPARRIEKRDLVGTWNHSVNYASTGTITLSDDGRIGGPQDAATWSLEGSTLRLRWPRQDAPGGAWVDECLIAPDGKSYLGRNQAGAVIRGVRDDKQPVTAPSTAGASRVHPRAAQRGWRPRRSGKGQSITARR